MYIAPIYTINIHVYRTHINYQYIYNIRTLSVNIKFICTSFRNRQNSEPLARFSYILIVYMGAIFMSIDGAYGCYIHVYWWFISVIFIWILIVYMGAIYLYVDGVYECYAHVYWLCIWVLFTCTLYMDFDKLSIYIQYTYIVGKYKIYLYEL
jgi:hypothetical protein